MRTRELLRLKMGDRVSVTGEMDGQHFSSEEGVVAATSPVKVRFDKWAEGHGLACRDWCFYPDSHRAFSITVLPDMGAAPTKTTAPAPVAPKKRPHGKQEYKGNGKHTWETVDTAEFGHVSIRTSRLRVPGGWLYRVSNSAFPKAMTFVPVPSAVGYAV